MKINLVNTSCVSVGRWAILASFSESQPNEVTRRAHHCQILFKLTNSFQENKTEDTSSGVAVIAILFYWGRGRW